MAVFRRRQFSAEKGICHIEQNNITQLPDPSGLSSDPFTDILRDGARKRMRRLCPIDFASVLPRPQPSK